MEDLFESSVFDPEEPPQWGEEGAEKVYAEVYGNLIKWHKENDEYVREGDILCQIEVIKPGVERGEEAYFVHSKPYFGRLKIKPKFERPPVYVFPDDVIAIILPWYPV